jgi:hypothetical protein
VMETKSRISRVTKDGALGVSIDMPFEIDLFHCRIDMLHVFQFGVL